MSDFSLFLGKFLTQGTRIASIAPSSRWLSRATVGNVDWGRAKVVVELGAGTGPITRAIAERAPASCRTIVLERDPDFSKVLRERFSPLPNFEVIEADVRDLREVLDSLGITEADHVISGLPVPSFPKSLQEDLFRALRSVLAPDGGFNQITEFPLVYKGLYRRYFDDVRFRFEPRNLPPAGVYYCRGPRSVP